MRPKTKRNAQAGISLLETAIALAILLTASVGIMTMAAVSMTATEDQGHLMARATEYAQDKMEQLIALSYNDAQTDTTQFPSANTGGTGLAIGGSTSFSAPTAGYVDYLDKNGNQLTSVGGAPPANWFYIRVWSISQPTGYSNVLQITVSAEASEIVGHPGGALPQATVVSRKTYPF
jgi:hypothetical protein